MSAGKYVRAPSVDSEEQNEQYFDDVEIENIGATEEVEFQEVDNNKDDLGTEEKNRELQTGWRFSAPPANSMQADNCVHAATRLENAPRFPKNVPTNRLLQEWNRFLEKFEIAASLSNINNPAQMAKHLFMCMGDDLQDIVCVAKLRPSLNDPRCYRAMVNNINAYLRKLTDPVTEHENFSRLSQGKDETIVNFHARLKSKAKLCEYGEQHEDRFVYAQLLMGMRDRKLAEDAKIYGHDIDVVVKAAARKESITSDIIPHYNTESGPEVLAVSRSSTQGNRPFRKRSGNAMLSTQRKLQRYVGKRNQGRRSRCWRCNSSTHTHDVCSAKDKKCFGCGIIGHYASACRRKGIRTIQAKEEKRNAPSGWTDDENQNEV